MDFSTALQRAAKALHDVAQSKALERVEDVDVLAVCVRRVGAVVVQPADGRARLRNVGVDGVEEAGGDRARDALGEVAEETGERLQHARRPCAAAGGGIADVVAALIQALSARRVVVEPSGEALGAGGPLDVR